MKNWRRGASCGRGVHFLEFLNLNFASMASTRSHESLRVTLSLDAGTEQVHYADDVQLLETRIVREGQVDRSDTSYYPYTSR